MDWKLFGKVFGSIFAAELGDKTQVATLLFAADERNSRWIIFAASAAALVVASGIGVLAGSLLSKVMNPRVLSWVAGLVFIGIGVWTILNAPAAPSTR